MGAQAGTGSSEEIARIIESAERLGVEINESEALQWLGAMAAWDSDDDVVFDPKSGVYGHTVTMLDFSPQQLGYYRRVGRLVEFEDEPGVVETALALSGSAAQSRIQSYPGDCDYFERVNIIADSRDDACGILARIMREKAINFEKGPVYQLVQVRFGSYSQDVVKDGEPYAAGSSISWRAAEVKKGRIDAFTPGGERVEVLWDDVALDPGWCKLDWVIADAIRGTLSNASNMLDVTWEAPDGSVTPLDGYLDPYFQEVYLTADSIPVFSKIVQHVSGDALDDYVAALEKEAQKYLFRHVNYGKAAKRMYNVFRYTGRYPEAAYLRELFDEPTTVLYQISALVRTLDEAMLPGSDISLDIVHQQADQLLLNVVEALTGPVELEMVKALLDLRVALEHKDAQQEQWEREVQAARDGALNVVNNFFYEKLTAVPSISSYIEGLDPAPESDSLYVGP